MSFFVKYEVNLMPKSGPVLLQALGQGTLL